MKMTFRWYGENDVIPLSYIKQIQGMDGVVSAVYDVKVGEVWPMESLEKLKKFNDEFDQYYDIIQFGDLVKLDVVVELDGYYGDNARTVCAGGAPDLLSEQLMAVTKASLEAGIDAAVDGATVNDVSTAVQRVVEAAGFRYCGIIYLANGDERLAYQLISI